MATFGGGEANVVVALASFRLPAAYLTVLPDENPIADAAIGELRRLGVDTSKIARGKDRVGGGELPEALRSRRLQPYHRGRGERPT